MHMFVFIFFFKQKTAYEMRISDWSSDVCSSDLCPGRKGYRVRRGCQSCCCLEWLGGGGFGGGVLGDRHHRPPALEGSDRLGAGDGEAGERAAVGLAPGEQRRLALQRHRVDDQAPDRKRHRLNSSP